MQIEQTVTEALHEAICALAALDLNKLKDLEERITALAASGDKCRNEKILRKKRLLGLILQNCKSNLDALDRLRGGNTREQWVH